MAKKTIPLTIFLLLSLIALCSIQVSALGGMVGGRTKIKDVKTNKEVQELGRYCVEEYIRNQRKQHESKGEDLIFSEVIEAEKQVVSGIKYYLKISATTSGGVSRTFDAVVVVKPWEKSRELLNFAPSPPTK